MAISVEPLPAPGPNQAEIQFRRLLLHCEARTSSDPTTSGSHQDAGSDWRADPKFHCVSLARQARAVRAAWSRMQLHAGRYTNHAP